MNLHTAAATKLLGSLALALVLTMGWLFVLSPQSSALGELQTQIANAKDQNDTLRLQLISLQRQAAGLDETKRTAHALAEKFPATADQPGLFRDVTAAAGKAGIAAKDVTALTPSPPALQGADGSSGVQLPDQAATGDLARQTVTVSVGATYDRTQRFLSQLESMPRAYLITSVTVTGDDTGMFTSTITGDMFVMPPAPEPEDLDASPAP